MSVYNYTLRNLLLRGEDLKRQEDLARAQAAREAQTYQATIALIPALTKLGITSLDTFNQLDEQEQQKMLQKAAMMAELDQESAGTTLPKQATTTDALGKLIKPEGAKPPISGTVSEVTNIGPLAMAGEPSVSETRTRVETPEEKAAREAADQFNGPEWQKAGWPEKPVAKREEVFDIGKLLSGIFSSHGPYAEKPSPENLPATEVKKIEEERLAMEPFPITGPIETRTKTIPSTPEQKAELIELQAAPATPVGKPISEEEQQLKNVQEAARATSEAAVPVPFMPGLYSPGALAKETEAEPQEPTKVTATAETPDVSQIQDLDTISKFYDDFVLQAGQGRVKPDYKSTPEQMSDKIVDDLMRSKEPNAITNLLTFGQANDRYAETRMLAKKLVKNKIIAMRTDLEEKLSKDARAQAEFNLKLQEKILPIAQRGRELEEASWIDQILGEDPKALKEIMSIKDSAQRADELNRFVNWSIQRRIAAKGIMADSKLDTKTKQQKLDDLRAGRLSNEEMADYVQNSPYKLKFISPEQITGGFIRDADKTYEELLNNASERAAKLKVGAAKVKLSRDLSRAEREDLESGYSAHNLLTETLTDAIALGEQKAIPLGTAKMLFKQALLLAADRGGFNASQIEALYDSLGAGTMTKDQTLFLNRLKQTVQMLGKAREGGRMTDADLRFYLNNLVAASGDADTLIQSLKDLQRFNAEQYNRRRASAGSIYGRGLEPYPETLYTGETKKQ